MCQPPGLAGSGSGSAQTASSKSRASSPSIVTSARSRRSARPSSARIAGVRDRPSASASAAAGNSAGMSNAAIVSRLIASGRIRRARAVRECGRCLPKRRDGSSSATTSSPSGSPAASCAMTRYSVLVAAVRRRDDAAVAGAAEHADDPVRRVFRSGDAPDDLGLDLAAIAPASSRARARSPIAELVAGRSRSGEIAAPRPRPTRRPGGPAETRRNRCRPARYAAISGSAPPAANFRSGPRTTSPERSIARSRPRNAGPSAGPRPKARAISRAVSGLADWRAETRRGRGRTAARRAERRHRGSYGEA